MLVKIKRLLQKGPLYRLYLLVCKRYRFWVQDVQYPRIYRRAAKHPVDENKVLFLECSRKALSNSFSVLYRTLEEQGGKTLRCHYLLHTTASRREQRKRCCAFVRDLATAGVLYLDEGTDILSHVPVRAETQVVQLWHGCGAFKKFGRSVAEKQFGASADYMDTHPFHSHYSLVTVSSPDVMWAYEEAMEYPRETGVVQPLGVSRTDVFFDKAFLESAKQNLLRLVPQSAGKRVLLYAPTFRGEIMDAYSPDVLDLEALRAALGNEWVLLCKHHPHVKRRPAIPQSCRDFAFDVTDSMTIEDLLCTADVCISDYSSLVFEYALFERPMLFLAYDLDDYFDYRGFYYDYNDLAPGPIVKDTDGVIDFLQHLDERFDRARVQAFRQKFMSACDGHATERILQYVEEHK
jgi:CDP-ribitol ribitolphosphotransferase